jgi:hypothetical protein
MKAGRNLLLLFLATVLAQSAVAQSAHNLEGPDARALLAGPSWTRRWDAAHSVLFVRKGWLLEKTGPWIRAYGRDGTQLGADINLFNDFPEAQKAGADDLAAGPNGTTIIAANLIFGPRPVEDLILTYDSSGKLQSFFNPAPYAAEAITADDQGNIYLLGERVDRREGDPPYPLLVKYDCSEKLTSNKFAEVEFR